MVMGALGLALTFVFVMLIVVSGNVLYIFNKFKAYISDKDIVWLLTKVIGSFQVKNGKGLPLGNLTSQLFANIYLNEFDQFIKHHLKVIYYIRYADDFVIL